LNNLLMFLRDFFFQFFFSQQVRDGSNSKFT
jgi:hypothetical protein